MMKPVHCIATPDNRQLSSWPIKARVEFREPVHTPHQGSRSSQVMLTNSIFLPHGTDQIIDRRAFPTLAVSLSICHDTYNGQARSSCFPRCMVVHDDMIVTVLRIFSRQYKKALKLARCYVVYERLGRWFRLNNRVQVERISCGFVFNRMLKNCSSGRLDIPPVFRISPLPLVDLGAGPGVMR
jgi:hypothetical protein